MHQKVASGIPANLLVARESGQEAGLAEVARIRKVVLPAAGLGTRLRPLTAALPKEMLPVGRRLVIQRVLEECEAAGLDQVLAVISRRKLALLDALETDEAPLDEQQMPRRLVYTILQRVQGGLGHAVLHAEGFAAGESFAVALADTLVTRSVESRELRVESSDRDEAAAAGLSTLNSQLSSLDEAPILARLVQIHREAGAAATIAAEEVSPERASRYGILAPAAEETGRAAVPKGRPGENAKRRRERRARNEQEQLSGPGPSGSSSRSSPPSPLRVLSSEPFRVRDVVEKPAPGTEPSRLAISARYVFSPAIFPALRRLRPGANGELQLTDAIRDLARQGLLVLGVRLGPGERRWDIGNFDSYREAVRHFGF